MGRSTIVMKLGQPNQGLDPGAYLPKLKQITVGDYEK
jgi:hypothetical protein